MQSTAPKTPRGIQEADVWAAADALLADGHKPTIEKVRQHMGRGSPNTVAPMLDAWFATLGARLGLNQHTQDLRNAVPTEVLEAAQALWSNAMQQAQALAVQALQTREEAAQAVQKQLEAQQTKLLQRMAPQHLRGFQHLGGHGVAQILRVLVQAQPRAQRAKPRIQHGCHGVG